MSRFTAGIFGFLIAAAGAETPTNVNGVRIDRLIPSGQLVTHNILKCLIELPVTYCDAKGRCDRTGILIVNKELKNDLVQAFAYMREIKFPISMMIPSHHFTPYPPGPSGDRRPGWDDEQIMSEDNTSSYNPRYIFGTDHASLHAFGEAIDINPRCNPAIHSSGLIEPANGRRKDASKSEPDCSMDSDKGKLVVQKFKSLGWNWGGDWTDPRDSQHFQKPGPHGNRVYIWNAQGQRVQAPHCAAST